VNQISSRARPGTSAGEALGEDGFELGLDLFLGGAAVLRSKHVA
jgi:hypothetical protein